MIVVENREGLGNKLKNVVSALRRAHYVDDRVALRFEHHGLFDIEQTNAAKPLEENLYTWQLLLLDHDLTQPIIITDTSFVLISSGKPVVRLNSIDYQYNNIVDSLKSDFLKYFGKIAFSPEILELVELFCDQNRIADCVGMQIRSWHDDQIRQKYLYDVALFDTIVEENSDKRFFVCSDDINIIAMFKNRYGPRIVWFAKNQLVHSSYDRSKRMLALALIDLLILSRTAAMVGSYQSTFCEAAWWLGGAYKTMVIPTTKIITDLNQATNKALRSSRPQGRS